MDEQQPSLQLSGDALIADPNQALRSFRAAGGTDQDLAHWYAGGESPVHLLRFGAQPAMLRASLKSMAPALTRELCSEAGVGGTSGLLLAEQVTEARCDEVYLRMLAGLALEEDDIARADRLQRMADRCSNRLTRSLDQLHRLRRPRVNVKISRAGNVNLGQQVVQEQTDADAR